ncbi:MAG: 16S rRNA (guanine(527)-N(7))-methyltransferase [Bacteroidetes bacterium GWE2_29_8]|nr:MAG: 16S rRNA (guanine(527)-N(7))-methyltransferase [Bacteroidetes bacterium GWE2_29_8]OFY17752.1 MAG: 16S rRNA (guanine(527)-N(7))-methyltransferase [Bacteroidetes bacterium GWF2_29_10]
MLLIKKYFPEITDNQIVRIKKCIELYKDWNSKINVISRKDIDNLEERHFLHSICMLKYFTFKKGNVFIDFGTGGGFPGIPLSIMLPDCHFYMIDSIGKKINVVNNIIQELGLKNAKAEKCRIEDFKEQANFVVSRAVMDLSELYKISKKNISQNQYNSFRNGILYLKGGDTTKDETTFEKRIKVYKLKDTINEEFFETKKLVYLPI